MSTPPPRFASCSSRATPRRLGREELELTVAPGSTVGAVLEQVRALPGGDALPSRPLCALNLAHVGPDAPVIAGDELAILPPLAGG